MKTKIKFLMLCFIFLYVFLFTFANASPQSTFNFQVFSQTECVDGIDNDNNGIIDYPADGGCESILDDNEATVSINGNSGKGRGRIVNVIIHPVSDSETLFPVNIVNAPVETITQQVFNNLKNLFQSLTSNKKDQNGGLSEKVASKAENNPALFDVISSPDQSQKSSESRNVIFVLGGEFVLLISVVYLFRRFF